MLSFKTIKYIAFSALLSLFYACSGNREKNELLHDHSHHSHEHNHGHNRNHNHEHNHAHDHGHEHSHESDTGHSHEHESDEEDAIIIEPEKATQLGIETEVVELSPFTSAIKTSGEIIAPPTQRHTISATTSGIIEFSSNVRVGANIAKGSVIGKIDGSNITGGDVAKSLKLEYDVAKAEYERLKPLFEQGVVSAKNFNIAKAEYEKARLALGSSATSTNSLVAPAAGTLISLNVNNGDYVEAGETIGVIGDNATLSLKADLPKRYHSSAQNLTDVYIVPSCGDCEGFKISDYNGRRVDGKLGVNDGMTGFYPVYFTFNNNGHIEGSGFVEVFLLLDTEKDVLSVPTTALLEQQGQWFVYIKLDDDCYEKRAVKTGGSNGENVVITSGIRPNEEIVTKGVTFVKLAESAGAVPEGHSHTH